ncbi:MAG: orotate phosphoribosyltransferase [Spirochaetae bacterium HGW-Spirochaetae-1]|jgi:orotate phosphoribosyltransferase|nr:MAG: orotate phosphoribosyltransferase [Spirochaetae bacterium HGW-Spirochaetae-1]
MNYKEQFIEFMVRSKVLTFGDFTTKSGRKTPFFINTGNYKTGEQITKLGSFYAECIKANLGDNFDVLYGPAYKGIPLCVTTSIALHTNHNINKNFCFNRKEAKDHGEGGSLIGYKPQDGDRIIIVEDVITAGTSVRESVPILMAQGKVSIAGLVISVDRMERGQGNKTALREVEDEFGIKTMSIVTIREIVSYLLNRQIDGKIILDDAIKGRIDEYMDMYGVK